MRQPRALPSEGFRALGVDPGLSTCGVAIVRVDEAHEYAEELRTITTTPSPKKRNVLANDDVFRRSREIVRVLRVYAANAHVICFEAWSPVRNAGAAQKVARTYGALAAICEEFDIPVVAPTPQQIKKKLTGRRDASKDDVRIALQARFDRNRDVFTRFDANTPKTKREHGYDALGVVVASLDSEILRVARKLYRPAS